MVRQMLWYAWVFLVIAILAVVFGFGGIAVAAAGIAKILFVIFLVLFVLSLIFGRRAVSSSRPETANRPAVGCSAAGQPVSKTLNRQPHAHDLAEEPGCSRAGHFLRWSRWQEAG